MRAKRNFRNAWLVSSFFYNISFDKEGTTTQKNLIKNCTIKGQQDNGTKKPRPPKYPLLENPKRKDKKEKSKTKIY